MECLTLPAIGCWLLVAIVSHYNNVKTVPIKIKARL
jgi:hypothetical protein